MNCGGLSEDGGHGREHGDERTRAGLIPNTYLMATKGRKTAWQRSNPVTIVEHDKQRWLVAPYGSVPWVHNARAASETTSQLTITLRSTPSPDGLPSMREIRRQRACFHVVPDRDEEN